MFDWTKIFQNVVGSVFAPAGTPLPKPLRIFGTALFPLVDASEKKKYNNRDGKIKRKMFGMKTFILTTMDITVWDILQIPTNHFMLMPKISTK